jgi:transcriptional regulator with XRE-family HTH domain
MIAKSDDGGCPNPLKSEPLGTEHGPTVLKMTLGGQMRLLRESRGISRETAAEAIRASVSKISRLEGGRTGFKERDIGDLLTLYGVTEPDERERYLALARHTKLPGWWHDYGDLLPPWFETYIGLEQDASIIRLYAAQYIPDLLQTPAYSRALIALDDGDQPARRLDMRLRRQQVLTRPKPVAVWAVIDEAALRRPVGGIEVLRSQIEYLVQLTDLSNVTIQILRFSAGAHGAICGSFSLLRCGAWCELSDIAYAEQLTGAQYLDKASDLKLYRSVLDKLVVAAEPPQHSAALLSALAADL